MDLHIRLSDARNVSVEVYRQIRDAILEGRLRARDVLPSTRELARQLQVSRNTVLVAYERLRAEGFVEARRGSRTSVGTGIVPKPVRQLSPSPLRPRKLWDELPAGLDMAATTAEFELRPGIPDSSFFPFAAWRVRVARQLQHQVIGIGAHINAAGHHGLRAAIVRHIAASRAVQASPDDVLVTNGSQQAIDLLARVLLEPGDLVAVEDPGYPLPRRALQVHGCRVVGVPVDEYGLMVSAIPSDVRLVYVTPSHQYPLGVAMTVARRQALLAWAQHANATIVEDDYDGEFRYRGRPLESLHSLDATGRVIYIGSLSKVMLPTLRLGYLVAPPSLHAALRKAKQLADWHTAVPMQGAAAQFIYDGLLSQHIRRMRRVYAERHERIWRILQRDFAGRLTPIPSSGGLHLTALLPEQSRLSDHAIAARAYAAGVAVLPLSYHYLTARPRQGLLLGYGAIASTDISEAFRRLSGCL